MKLFKFLKRHGDAVLSGVYFYICFISAYLAYRFYEKPAVFSIFVIIALIFFLLCLKRLIILGVKSGALGKLFSGLSRFLSGAASRLFGGRNGDGDRESKIFIGGYDRVSFGREKKSLREKRVGYPKLRNMKTAREKARYSYIMYHRKNNHRVNPTQTARVLSEKYKTDAGVPELFEKYEKARYADTFDVDNGGSV